MNIALMFPGYSSQFVGMGKELYDEHRMMQELFEQASSCLDSNFVKLCFASSDAELAQMHHAYTSVFLVSAAIAALLKESGIKIDAVTGYNQGIYAALFAADGLSLPDGLYLLNKFASFYEEAQKEMDWCAIQVSGLSDKEINDICAKGSTANEKVYVSIYEMPTQQIVAGATPAVERVRDAVSALADERDISIEPVDLAVGLHSELIEPVINQFKMYLNKVDFHDLSVPLIEGTTGKRLQKGAAIHEYVVKHISAPIRWPLVMKKLASYDLIVEVGPGSQLTSWFQELYPDKKVVTINKPEDIKKLLALVQPHEQAQAEEESNS